MKANILNETIGTLGLFHIKLYQYHWHIDRSYLKLHETICHCDTIIMETMDQIAALLIERKKQPISTLAEFIEYSWVKEHPYFVKLNSDDLMADLKEDLNTMRQQLAEYQSFFTDDQEVMAIFTKINNQLIDPLLTSE